MNEIKNKTIESIYDMKKLLLFLFALSVMLLTTSNSFGQTANDYRTVSSGNWNSSATWEQYIGGVWTPASSFPNSATAVCTVQVGHTVSLSAAAQVKTLYLYGIVSTTSVNILTINYLGSIIGGSSTAFISGPLAYQVTTTAGGFKIINLPLGKNSIGRPAQLKVGHNRTNLVTYTIEMFNSAPPANTIPAALGSVSSVRYYSVSRTLYPTVTSNGNLTLSYDTDDGVGNFNSLLRVVKDNGAGTWQDLGGTGSAPVTGTIASVTTASLLSTNTFALAKANVLISGNAGVGGATLNYFDGTNKTVTSAANGTYSFYTPAGWSGSIVPTLQYYNFTPAQINLNNVMANQTNQNFTAKSLFTDFRTAGPGDWNDPLIWEGLYGTDWVPSSVPTGTAGSILIRDVDEVNLNVPINLDSLCTLSVEGILHVQAALTIKAGATLINKGTLDNPNIGTDQAPNHPGSIKVYGTYEHAQDGGMLGIAGNYDWYATTYYTGSKILITGVINAAPTVPAQTTLTNTIWNCPNQADDAFLNINGTSTPASGNKDLYVSFGNFTVLNSNSHNIYMFSGQGRSVGDIIVDGPTSKLTAFTRSSMGIEYAFFSYFSNLTVRNGGQFYLSTDPGVQVKDYVSINVHHNLTVSSSSVLANYCNPYYSGESFAKIIFTSNYPHTVDLSGQVSAEGLDAYTNLLNFSIDNNSVTLNSPIKVRTLNFLSLNSKVISNGNLITIAAGGSASVYDKTKNFTDGPMAYEISSVSPEVLNFFVGKGTISSPVILNLTQDSPVLTTYTLTEKMGTPSANIFPSTLMRSLSSTKYYNIVKSEGASVLSASIQLTYDITDQVGSQNADIRIVGDDGSGNWVDLGGSGSAASAGTITSANNFTTMNNFAIGYAITGPYLIVNSKVFLSSAYNNAGGMSTTLNSNNLIPLNSELAYAASNYGYTASTLLSIPNANIVDWLLIELRNAETTASSTVIKKQAAFLLSNGTIVDIDGLSPLLMTGIDPGDYYIVVRHRNHLGIMSAVPVSLGSSSPLYDFTTDQTQAYGSNSMLELTAGLFGLISGDVNNSGIITISDINPVITNLNSTSYNSADVNLSGIITISDVMKIVDDLNKNSNIPN